MQKAAKTADLLEVLLEIEVIRVSKRHWQNYLRLEARVGIGERRACFDPGNLSAGVRAYPSRLKPNQAGYGPEVRVWVRVWE
jgi:hypothetical protein